MRKWFLIILVLTTSVFAKSGVWFSFKTGFPLTGSSVGLKMGSLAPYGGIDAFRINMEVKDEYTSWDTDYWGNGNLYKKYERTSTFSASVILFAPHAGLRFYLKQSTLKLYVKGDIMLFIPSVDGKDKGERIWYNPDGSIEDIDKWDDSLDNEDIESIEDALDMITITPGIGIEYPISDHFSIGGEFGFRLFLNSIDTKNAYTDEYDGEVEWKEESKNSISSTLGFTYTSITLNFIL